MPYVPNATDTSEPLASQSVESAALEFRTLKTSINSRVTTEIANRVAGDAALQAELDQTQIELDLDEVRITALEQLAFNGSTPGAVSVTKFTANGVSAVYTLPVTPITVSTVDVYIQGIHQEFDTYSVVGNLLTLSTVPTAGWTIEVKAGVPLSLGITTADQVEYTPAGTGAVATTVQAKLRQLEISPFEYGAVGGATSVAGTDDSGAFNLAIAAAAANNVKVFRAVGSFRLNSQVNLLNGITYDFTGATFYKGAVFDYCFKADAGQDHIRIFGGYFKQASYSPTIVTGAGTYVSGSCFYIVKCTDVVVDGVQFYNQFVCCDIYDCTNVKYTNTYSLTCNATVAVICSASANGDVSQIWVENNTMINGGDDAIAIGPVGTTYNVKDVTVRGNVIDKSGIAVASSVAIRSGRYGGGTGICFRIIIDGNICVGMTDQALYITKTNQSQITNNIISGYARAFATAAIVLGGASNGCDQLLIVGNHVVNPTAGNSYVISAEELTNSKITGNIFDANLAGLGALYINSGCSYLYISDNSISNAALDLGIQILSTADYITITDNDLRNCANGVINFGSSTNSKVRANKGYVSFLKGMSGALASAGTITHGLAKTPSFISLLPLGAPGPSGVAAAGVGATTFAVYFSGGGSYEFWWSASTAENLS